jgi:hypothetical protein
VSVALDSPEIQELLAKQAIHEVVLRYCRGVDRVDSKLIAAAFHPDATCEFGTLLLSGENIGTTIANAAASNDLTTHMVGNALYELHGEVAHGETYYLSSGVADGPDGKQLRMRAGRYVDRFELRVGTWKIAERVVVQDWCQFSDLPALPEGVSFRQGLQGSSDPLYALLGSSGS